jgi:pimeloyl-ACP methyl ester carboxylesterase
LEKLTYLKISLQLNREANLFEFPYDWRRPIEHSADRLREHIDRWCGTNPNQKFSLVAHSMGGLVSRAYLARHPAHAEKHITRLIMHGTPNFGAANAIDNLVNGNAMMATVDQINAKNDMKTLVYCLPSVYQLLPAPAEFFPSGKEYPIAFDLYDARSWQMQNIQQKYLDSARNLYQVLANADPQLPVYVIAGAHIETMVSARLAFEKDIPHLEMTSVDRGENSGDGTVALWSAELPGATTFYVQAVHRALPGNRKIIRATIDLIQNGSCDLPETLPPPKLISFEAQENLPPVVQAEVLQSKIAAGTANEADLQSLYFAF